VVEQLPEVATLVVPVGGGGLASGVGLAVRALRPDCRIVAVQTAAFPSLRRSLEAGEPTVVPASPTIADGIAVKQIGARNFELLRGLVDEVVEVEEEELSTAMLWSMERAKQVLEGAGAAALAALLAGKVSGEGPIALVVAGGNIDPAGLIPVIRHGLTAVGRYLYLGTVIPDRPGELSRLLALLADLRVNVLGVEHHREGVHLRVGETQVDLTLQTRNAEHVAAVHEALREAGYPVLESR
jgi:threonine dehydratase